MDGILTSEQLQALEAQAAQEQQALQRQAMQQNLERDAALAAQYSGYAGGEQIPVMSSMANVPLLKYFFDPVQGYKDPSAQERLKYAQDAINLQNEINKRVQSTLPKTPQEVDAALSAYLGTPVKKEQTAQPVAQPQPTSTPEATAQPSANAPVPAPEKPQYDPFAEFNNYEKTRKKFFNIAFKYVSQVPIQYQDEALKLVKEEWDNTGPSLPKSTLLPLKHPATGEILKDQALTADGRIVELKTPPAEKALTEAQEKNLKFAGAMHRANKEYENLVRASGYDPSNPLNRLPMFEMLKTQNRKLYEGIVNEFTNAINRDQSGASVTPAEFQAAERRYFPLAGDTEEVLKAKEARRKEMVASMYDLVPEYARDKIQSYGTNQPQQSAPGAGGGFYFNTKTGRMEPR